MTIRNARPSDAPAWEAMRCKLWPDGAAEHADEIADFFADGAKEPCAVLVAEDEPGRLIGVAELSLRDDVAGLAGERTGYVEGLYVVPEWRSRGIAQKLLREAKLWAYKNNCTAFASDRAERVIIDKRF
ncbi:MAG TPA: GNAT family N-acetyltransferase [Candidatus Acidoferrum sp.]|nr:GNAT family N-acetyltransferase [Candidatus Acidoferrum sp.]